MSTRWYPLYQKGNPQLRVFLPNFWLKLVKPERNQPENIVQFQCSLEMTKHDIKNYLTKIYNVPIVNVRTRIAMGKFKREPQKGYIMKEDDVKIAYAMLPKDQKFVYPDIFPKDKTEQGQKETDKSVGELKKSFQQYLDRNKERPGVPNWFTI